MGSATFNSADPRRRVERHQTDLESDLGAVVDLSSAGMRIETSGKPAFKSGQTRKIKIHIPEGNLVVTGRAVWVHRLGLRKHQMGIQFIDVSKKMATALDNLGRFGFLRGAGDGANTTTAASPWEQSAKHVKTPPRPDLRVSMKLPDYYGILGIERGAKLDDIRCAYRALARKLHPDVTEDPDGPAKFIEVQEAYTILKDEKRRRAYDTRLSA